MKFSANLGFLWQELPLADAIRAAKKAGFDAVECHWPYDQAVDEVKAALQETGFAMLGLNTVRGNEGENGLCALKGREAEARQSIDQGIDYAAAIGAKNIHVMAGFASGIDAHECFVENLNYACAKAAPHGITILIEPLNHRDAPNYFLTTAEQAVKIINEVNQPNLKLMFDVYHMQIMGGDIFKRIEAHFPHIGHIQIAGVPKRGRPDEGEIHFPHLLSHLNDMGWTGPIGAEYKPFGDTQSSLSWLSAYKK